MARDCYVAICNPLLYTLIMSKTVCLKMAAGAFTAGLLNSVIHHTGYVSSLSFCSSNVIHHFFCDSPPLFKLSCSDTCLYESIMSTFAGVNMVRTLLVILTSYSYILFSIFHMHTGEGRHKAFSTFASHLAAIILFYSTSIYTYLRPSSSYSLTQDKVASVFYTVVIPMLNPLIYSLQNRGVKKGSGWGTYIYLWQIHFDIWQNQYNIVKLNKIKFKKKKALWNAITRKRIHSFLWLINFLN